MRGNAAFRRLWFARSISFAGDSLGLIALILYASHGTAGAIGVALLLLAGDFAPALFSPLTSILSDRVGRRKLMISCELLRGAIFTIIALARPPLIPLLALVAFQALVGSVFQPASRSVVPQLVSDDELATANATLGFGTHGLEVLGPALAALALPALGLRGVLLADAATFGVAALLLVGLPPLLPGGARPTGQRLEREGILAASVSGMVATWRRPVVRVVAIGFFVVVAFTAVDDVALVFLARQLGAGDAATSLLYAGSGIGIMVGLALLVRWVRLVPVAVLLAAGFALMSLGNLATGLVSTIAAVFAMQALRGIGISLNDTGVATFLQRWVPLDIQGRVFGNLYGSLGIAAGLSYLIGGLLVQAVGPRPVFIGAGAGGLLAAGAIALALRRETRR